MKKYKYILVITSLSLLFCQKVYANCTDYEINHFKEIESKCTVTYDYDKVNNKNIIKYYNPEPQTYEYRIVTDADANANVVIKRIDNYNYEAIGDINATFTIEVIGKSSTCDDVLKTITVNPPQPNGYAEDELCKGIEDFILCQPDYDKTITREEFESRVESYKKTLEKDDDNSSNPNNSNSQDNKNNQEEKKNFLGNIIDYIKNNWLQVLIITIFIILIIVTIIITIISTRKSRRLE